MSIVNVGASWRNLLKNEKWESNIRVYAVANLQKSTSSCLMLSSNALLVVTPHKIMFTEIASPKNIVNVLVFPGS